MKLKYFIQGLLIAAALLAISATAPVASAQFGFGISVGFAPPPLPVYEQPICPGDGYIWTPGYWAYNDDEGDYYWVPGTWVVAPQIGYLWTPGYWGWGGDAYLWHGGYWGEHVGFYGGVDYGFGYGGFGYEGGRWDRDRFYYNTSVNNVNINEVHNTYNTTVINNNTNINNVSYNGGNGGINATPTSAELAANRERHAAATSVQLQHERLAGANRAQFASVNNGRPTIAATARPAVFSGRGVVAASAAGARPTNIAANPNRPANTVRPTSPANSARVVNNLGRPASTNNASNNNGPLQNRNTQRDNAFAHSQNRPASVQGGFNTNSAFANRPPSSVGHQQFDTQRSALNNTQNNSRQFVNSPAYSSAPSQHTNAARPQPNPAYLQNSQPTPAFRPNTSQRVAPEAPRRQYAAPQQHAAPSYASRPAPQQAPSRQYAAPQQHVAPSYASRPAPQQAPSRQYAAPQQHAAPSYASRPAPQQAPSRQYAAPQQHAAPSYASRPAPQQAPSRQYAAPQQHAAQGQPNNGGNHNRGR